MNRIRRTTTLSILALALGFFLLAATADADELALGHQQEPMTPTRCDQIVQLRSDLARMMVQPERWDTDRDRYIATAQRCHALGLRVVATFTHWNGTGRGLTAQQWEAFAAVAVRDLGPWVDVWSPINEPNHRAFAPAYNAACTGPVAQQRPTSRRVSRFKRVRRGSYRRVKRAAGGWRYVKVRHRRGHFKRLHRTITTWHTVTVTAPLGAKRCAAIATRYVHDAVAAQIQQLDPTAQIIIGDTAGPGSDFVRAFLAARPGRPLGQILGIHYSAPNVGVHAIADQYGLSIWVTETGIEPSAQDEMIPWLTDLEEAGVAVAIYYGGLDYDPHWRNFQLTPAAQAAAAAWN